MFKYIKEYRFYIILFLFVLIPLIAIDTSTRSPRNYQFHDRVILTITSPIQNAISWSLVKVISFFQNYVFLIHTRQDNISLIDENRKLSGLIASLRETENENLRLKSLLDYKEKLAINSVLARVIARDISVDFRTIRINRGLNAGIQKNMAVIKSDGIVGRILRTTATTSDVVTILDPLSAVDAIVERSRARGIVEGLSEDLCQLRFALRTDDIQTHDKLITSGLEGVFPKGIPVGNVSRVNKRPFGITQEVEVKPNVDFSRLEEVLVVTSVQSEHVPAEREKKEDKGKP